MNTDQETTQNNLSPTPLPIPSASGNGNGAPSGQGLLPILPSSSAPSTPTSTPASSGNGAVLPIANNNPGDLKNPSTGTFQKYSSTKEGTIALLNDLQTSMKAHPNWTLIDFAKSYAPNSDGNNSLKYAANLANYLDSQGVKINPNTDPISSLQPNIFYFANAVSNAEGYGNAINPNTIPKTNNQLPSSSNKQQTQQPGWLQSLIQGIAKPFAQTAVTGSKILTGIPALVGEGLESAGVVKNPQTKENIQKAVDYTKSGAPVNLGFLGKVSPLGVNEKTGQQLPTGKGIEQALGTGAEMATTVAGGGETGGDIVSGEVMAKLGTITKEGAVTGGVYGAGNAFTGISQKNQSFLQSALNVGLDTIGGVLGGGILGGIAGLGSTSIKLAVGIVKNLATGKGLGASFSDAVKNITSPLEDKYVKQVSDEWQTQIPGKTKAQKATILAQRGGKKPIDILSKSGISVNDVTTQGKFDATKQDQMSQVLRSAVHPLEKALNNLLTVVQRSTPKIPISDIRGAVINNIENNSGRATVGDVEDMILSANKEIDALEGKYGKNISLPQLNSEKSKYWSNTKFQLQRPLQGQVNYQIGSAVKTIINKSLSNVDEDSAKLVKELNDTLGNYYEASKFLDSFTGNVSRRFLDRATGGVLRGGAAYLGSRIAGFGGGMAGYLASRALVSAVDDLSNPLKEFVLRNMTIDSPDVLKSTMDYIVINCRDI